MGDTCPRGGQPVGQDVARQPVPGGRGRALPGRRQLWRQQPLRRTQKSILPGDPREPAFRNAAQAMNGAGELPRHRRHRIGIVG